MTHCHERQGDRMEGGEGRMKNNKDRKDRGVLEGGGMEEREI